MKSDPVIDEIRRVRHEMSAEIGHDPKRLLEYYAEIQERYRDRLVNYGRDANHTRAKDDTRAATDDVANDAGPSTAP